MVEEGFGWGTPPRIDDEDDARRVGRVITVERRHWHVATVEGTRVAAPAGRLYGRSEEQPVVGDWVVLEDGGGRERIVRVLPRANRIIRSSRRKRSQTLCANVDLVVAVTAAGHDFSPRRVERMLALAREGGCTRGIVACNKVDLGAPSDEAQAALRESAGDWPVLLTSAKTGQGMQDFLHRVPTGATVVLLGSSGVGKSSLTNRVLGESVQEVGEVREADHKGRHTTTQRRMIRGTDALVIDSPGLREFGLASDLADDAFPDIEALAEGCRFRDCRHLKEPGCAVRASVEAGALSSARYRSFLDLRTEGASRRRR